jgi:hypothetical protein
MDTLDDIDEWSRRAAKAQAAAVQAYARLLSLAETRDSGQIARVARFIASTFNGEAFPFDLFELRGVDVEISDDMLVCLDALRWAKADLYKLVPDGERRILQVIKDWGLKWPDRS